MINSYNENFTKEEQEVVNYLLDNYEGENKKNPFYNAWDFRKLIMPNGETVYYGRRMKSIVSDVEGDNFYEFVEALYSLLTSKQRAT